MPRRVASVGVLVVTCASAFVIASFAADDKKAAVLQGGGGTVSSGLNGSLRVEEPVPLKGPPLAVLRRVEVGDRVLLQVSYDERTENLKTITAVVSNRAMSAVEIINSQHQLVLLKDGGKAEGKPGSYFAVLLKANSPGTCKVTVTGELADGTKKDAPFQFEIK